MTQTSLYHLVSSELASQTDALDEEEIREISKAIAQKIADECPDIEQDETVLVYEESEDEE